MRSDAMATLQNVKSANYGFVVLVGPGHRRVKEKAIGKPIFVNGISDVFIRGSFVGVEYRTPWDHYNFVLLQLILFDDILLGPISLHANIAGLITESAIEPLAACKLCLGKELGKMQMLQIVWLVSRRQFR
jgi:hypothetical protein